MKRESVFAGILLAVVTLTAISADEARPDPFQPVRFMVGDWTGEAQSEPGKGSVERQYALILGDRFIEERNTSTYESRDGKPPEVHEHRSIFSYDRTRKTLMLRQFHEE